MADLNLNQENDLLLPDPEFPVIPEPEFPDPEFPENEFVPNQVVVKFNPEISEDEVKELLEQLGAEVIETIDDQGIQLWGISEFFPVEEAMQFLNEDERVEFSEPNYIVTTQATVPNDPGFNQQWHLENYGFNSGGGTRDADIDATEGWDFTTGDPNVVVAVIDTGIDDTHPDLAGNVIVGRNFVGANNNTNTMDTNGHGTYVAGTIGAVGNNGIGVTGVSWDVSLMPLKAFDSITNDTTATGTSFDITQAINYAVNNGAHIINASWGNDTPSLAMLFAMSNANLSDVLIVAAAGNDNRDIDIPGNRFYPASYPLDGIISVASTDHHDLKSDFSNYGAISVDLGAPGGNDLATLTSEDIYSTLLGGAYGYNNGTSMAAAVVSGIASLVKSRDPSLNYVEVKNTILDIAEDKPGLDPITLTGRRARTWGDPHLVTFDGKKYDFQATGDFILMESPGAKADDPDDDFAVHVRQESSFWPNATVNTGAAIKVNDYSVVLYAEPQLQNSIFDLNDPSAAPITLQPGESFQLGDDAAVTRTGNNFEISSTWENVSVNYLGFGGNGLFNIKLDRFMNQPVTGLLGNSNGNPNDDIALRDGTVIPPNKQTFNFLTTTFAESWQVPEEESLFENPIELAAPEQEVTIETLDPQLTETAFAIVEESDVEIPEEFVDEVAFDVALTLEGLGFEPGNNDPELEEIAGEIVTNLEGFFDDSDDLSPAQLTDESNDTIEEAISLPNDSGSYSYKGFIGDNPNVAPSDDVDLIKLELNQGGRAVIDINAREYGSALDSVLRVFDSTGNEVAFNDDSFVTPDSYRDSFIDFTAPVSDTYYVGVSSYHNFEYNPFTEGSGKGYTTGEYDISISIENPTAMGETGSISNLTHTAQTINLSRNYLNPVVFAQPLSYNGTAPATVRLDNITSNSFTVSVQEPSNENGIHGAENLSFMVLEAGNWELADGTVLEVGTTQSSQLVANGFETVNFDADFDSTPVVMSQVQTLNGTDFVRTRQDDITQSGFLVGMEEEEANATSGHANETIGYMAMSGGSGNWSGLNYIADYTGDIVTHAWETVNFGAGFTQAPQLLASLASYDGADAAGIRYDSLGSSSVQFKVEEDTSFDSEMLHTTENVSFLAIEGSGILEAFVI